MKKIIVIALCLLMVFTFAACGGSGGGDASSGSGSGSAADASTPEPAGDATGETIYVLGPTPDHGWTAQAGTYASAKVDEINAEGTYKASYMAASSGEEQDDQVQTIIANGDAAGVVFFALDDSAKSGQEALIGADVPFISFDRIIEGPDKSAILNFSGNNWQCGAGIAYWLQQKGMKPGDTLVTLIGDNGTVCTRRQEGFEQFLRGEIKYSDKHTGADYETTEAWTQEQIDALTADYKNVCDWSADGAYGYLEQKLGDIVSTAKAGTGNLYVFSQDDEMTFGFLNLLEGNSVNDATKADLKALNVYVSAIGGMAELYSVIDGTSAQAGIASDYFDGLMSVYFSPQMMNSAIDYLQDYLAGDWSYAVGDGEYAPVWIVDEGNVSEYEGFTGH